MYNSSTANVKRKISTTAQGRLNLIARGGTSGIEEQAEEVADGVQGENEDGEGVQSPSKSILGRFFGRFRTAQVDGEGQSNIQHGNEEDVVEDEGVVGDDAKADGSAQLQEKSKDFPTPGNTDTSTQAQQDGDAQAGDGEDHESVIVKASTGPVNSKACSPRKPQSSPEKSEVSPTKSDLTPKRAHGNKPNMLATSSPRKDVSSSATELSTSVSEALYIPESILAQRLTASKLEFLVEWKDYPKPNDYTWEPEHIFKEDAPDLVTTFEESQKEKKGKKRGPKGRDKKRDPKGKGKKAEVQVLEVETILEKKVIKSGKVKYLVKWKGYEAEKDRTWEPKETLNVDVPDMIEEFEEGNE